MTEINEALDSVTRLCNELRKAIPIWEGGGEDRYWGPQATLLTWRIVERVLRAALDSGKVEGLALSEAAPALRTEVEVLTDGLLAGATALRARYPTHIPLWAVLLAADCQAAATKLTQLEHALCHEFLGEDATHLRSGLIGILARSQGKENVSAAQQEIPADLAARLQAIYDNSVELSEVRDALEYPAFRVKLMQEARALVREIIELRGKVQT